MSNPETPQDQHILISKEQLTELAGDVTERVLLRIGFDTTSAEEMSEIKKDQIHLRRWRVAVDRVGNAGIVSVVTTIVGGLAAAAWLGFQHMVGRA